MASKRERAFRKVRVVIDVVNIILSIAVVGITVYTFMDVHNRMHIFPGIFYLGALINAITGVKHVISDNSGRAVLWKNSVGECVKVLMLSGYVRIIADNLWIKVVVGGI